MGCTWDFDSQESGSNPESSAIFVLLLMVAANRFEYNIFNLKERRESESSQQMCRMHEIEMTVELNACGSVRFEVKCFCI